MHAPGEIMRHYEIHTYELKSKFVFPSPQYIEKDLFRSLEQNYQSFDNKQSAAILARLV